MAIPAADPNTLLGSLPPGEHDATWNDVMARFGGTTWRLELLDGLKRAIDVLASVGATRLYLDGSFVTEKLVPGDFDGCYDITQADLGTLAQVEPVLLDFTNRRAAMKARYKGELFPAWFVAAGAPSSPIQYRDFFQQDGGASKGIVAIDLGTW